MFKSLKNKLNQERGASLTYALLLFMVCAVVGSVVLTAATAAAGRASENYAYDQRYYSVTSAAELFSDKLGGESVTFDIVKKSYYDQTTTTVCDAEGKRVGDPATSKGDPYDVSYTLERNGQPLPTSSSNLLEQAMLAFIGGRDAATLFSAASLDLTDEQTLAPLTLSISAAGTGAPDVSKLNVTVKRTLKADGSLELVFSNDNGDADKYELVLTLSANRSVNQRSFEVLNDFSVTTTPIAAGSTPAGGTTTVRTDIFLKQETKTVTITWRTSEIGKAA